MRKIIKYFYPYKKLLIISLFLSIIRVSLEFLMPFLMGRIIDVGLKNSQDPDTKLIIIYSAIMVGTTLVVVILGIIISYIEAKITSKITYEIRKDVYHKITSMDHMNEYSVETLMTRSTNDIQQIQGITNNLLRLLIFQPLLLIGSLIIAMLIDPYLTVIMFVAVLLIVIIIILVLKSNYKRFAKLQDEMDKLNHFGRNNIAGIVTVKSLNLESIQLEKGRAISSEIKNHNIQIGIRNNVLWPLLSLVCGVIGIIIIYLGILSSRDSGDIIAISQYAIKGLGAFVSIVTMLILLPRALVSVKRINEIMAIEPLDGAKNMEFNQTISFNNVSYQNELSRVTIINDINFTIEKSKTTAIIGPTGSGKTTLVNLLLNTISPSHGSITVDDNDLRDINTLSLYQVISYVPQEADLFSDTLLNNIIGGRKYLADKMTQTLSIAKIELTEYTNGLDHIISDNGSNLSLGQKQQIAIARAIYKNPQIYIFDDAFHSLDNKLDEEIRQNISNQISGTKIIISKRVNVVKDADKIVVLRNGQIESIGTHSQLIQESKTYKEAFLTQQTKEGYNEKK